jgi:hypothetical protein
VNGVGFTDPNEVRVYHPGTDLEIHPSRVTIAGGTLTIYIPRARCVTYAKQDNPDTGWEYTDTGNFEATIDVKRKYMDTAVTAQLVSLSYDQCCPITEDTGDACTHLNNADMGLVQVRISDPSCLWFTPHWIDLYYLAGRQSLTPVEEDAIVRLANSRMPEIECGCDGVKGLWTRDKKTPEILSTERLNCPFGLSDGAWQAYRAAQTLRQVRLGVL